MKPRAFQTRQVAEQWLVDDRRAQAPSKGSCQHQASVVMWEPKAVWPDFSFFKKSQKSGFVYKGF